MKRQWKHETVQQELDKVCNEVEDNCNSQVTTNYVEQVDPSPRTRINFVAC